MKAKRFILFPLIGVAVLAVFSTAVMLLWNFVVPGIFGLATINFWQALGLFLLTHILFGHFPGRRGMPHGKGMNPFRAKWEKMTPEERKKFIDRRKEFGFGGPFGFDRFGGKDTHECNHSGETTCDDK